MSTNCLLVIEEDSPLNFALEMLFSSDAGIKAVKSEARTFQEFVEEACRSKTQVVLLEDAAAPGERNTLTQLLMSTPPLKIIVILRDSNYIHVFRKEEILIQSSAELIEAIQKG